MEDGQRGGNNIRGKRVPTGLFGRGTDVKRRRVRGRRPRWESDLRGRWVRKKTVHIPY